MLMSAGLGTRLRPFTDEVSKALMPVLGVPAAQFAVSALAEAGVGKIVANVHHLAEKTRTGLLSLELGQAELRISDEEGLLMGSAGGLRKGLPLLGGSGGAEPFFWLNGDVICDIDLRRLALHHARLRARFGVTITLALYSRSPTGEAYREIVFDPRTDLVTGFGKPEVDRPFFVSVAVIEPEALKDVPDASPSEFLPQILSPAIAQRKAGAFLTQGVWHDIGSPGQWLRTHLGFLQGLESGALPKSWRGLVERRAARIGEQAWVSRDRRFSRKFPTSEWVGPCYWGDDGFKDAGFPRFLGPRAVVYGDALDSPYEGGGRERLTEGIGFRGDWVGVK
jgi:N-acetyl-alpha-D-muramate 1-phosphate uridylyltransferase